MKKGILLSVALTSTALIWAQSDQDAVGATTSAEAAQLALQAGSENAANYVLQPSDLILVRVFQEPDLDRELRVAQDQTITLPLIGTISVQGKSPRQLEAEIRDLYDKDYLVNPQINVSVVQYSLRTVSVLGQVNSPGPVPFPPEEPLRLIDAIARAGGFSRLARPANMVLTRKNPDGTSQTFPINGDELMRGTSSLPWFLQRDDVIFVPERIF